MSNSLTTFHSADAIVVRDDVRSGSQHMFLQRDASSLFSLQYLQSSFESPDRVESTIIQASDLRLLVFFNRVLQQMLRVQGIYIFLGLDKNNLLFDLHPEHHLMHVALAMDMYGIHVTFIFFPTNFILQSRYPLPFN